ncbi:uncharacterized protein PRCAT00001601001 [Priceomyces carsonii]|uniref:uncharacterized protein n=1 Tax=Priceomyces carsonii TaxID=28549 RepID=UPI002ED876B8|nr:unnamed protein product [Priceomyces carsonii]
MQGTYKDNGLPRPYYMKPSRKKLSHYEKLPINAFNTPRRKLLGYIVMIVLFGSCMYWISQDLKPKPDPVYEILEADDVNKNIENIVNTVGSVADKESDNLGLAGNLAQNSKGQIGHGVLEAPKGGIANEAPLVGNDEDEVVGNMKGKNGNQAPLNKGTDSEFQGDAGVP